MVKIQKGFVQKPNSSVLINKHLLFAGTKPCKVAAIDVVAVPIHPIILCLWCVHLANKICNRYWSTA